MRYHDIVHLEELLRTMQRLGVIRFFYINKKLATVYYDGNFGIPFTIEYS